MATSQGKPDLWSQYSPGLAGGWKCISYQVHDTTNPNTSSPPIQPHGEVPLGRVLISPGGYLSAHLANASRMHPLPSGQPWQTGTDSEVATVARGLSMYCGQTELFEDEKGLYWQTRVEVRSDPGRFGGLEVRRLEFEMVGDGKKEPMVLRPERDLVLEDGRRVRAVLKWERFE